jgi:hypothetical protein
VKIEYNENGYPTEPTITRLVSLFGFNWQLFTFNESYGTNRAVVYYRPKALNKPFGQFVKFLEFAGVEVEQHKTDKETHQIWLKKRNFEQ